jgi:hypothetical protein
MGSNEISFVPSTSKGAPNCWRSRDLSGEVRPGRKNRKIKPKFGFFWGQGFSFQFQFLSILPSPSKICAD